MSEPAVHRERLPNGLTLLLRESHLAPVVSLQFWVGVGSADERDDEAGLAHFHEHMLFKGTARRGVGEIAGEVESVGGRINAYTSFDMTVYYATLPSSALGVGVDVLSDAIRFSSFDPVEIEREIEVVLEEIRRSEDSPGHVLGDALFHEAYRRHPYRNPILGTRESVSRFDRDRVRHFFERWYHPGNLVLVAVGDFERAAMRDALARAFADFDARGATRHRDVEPSQTALRSVVLRRPFERASLEVGALTIGLGHEDAPLLDLLAFVLGEGDSSRLVRRVKEQQALADRIDAGAYTPLDPGMLSVSADLDPHAVGDAVASIAGELERLRCERVSAAELEKARANFLASEHFERESVGGQAGKLGGFEVMAGGHEAETRYMEAIRTATTADLQRVAREYLDPSRLTVGVLLPEDAEVDLGAADITAAVERGAQRTREVFALPAARREHDVQSYTLPGGCALHVLRRPEVPVASLRAAFRGGLLTETEPTAGLTHFMTSLWMRGTRSHSAAGLARAIESLAIDIDGFAGRSSHGLVLDATVDRLDAALDLFGEVLLEPAFEPAEVERQRRETLASLARREDRLGVKAFDLFSREHFGSHPYGHPVAGTEAALLGFSDELLRTHHEAWTRAGNLAIGIAGAVDPDTVASQVSSRLASLPSGTCDPKPAAMPPPPDEIRTIELRKDRAQAHLLLGFRGLTVGDPDRHALELIAQLLAGQGGRLFLELRDKRSLAYSVNAMSVEGLAPGFFATTIATAPDKVDEARQGMLDELRKLLEDGPTPDELLGAQRHLVGSYRIDQQRNANHALHLALDALYGLGVSEGRLYPDRIMAVSRDDVSRVARRVLRLDAYTLAVIHP